MIRDDQIECAKSRPSGHGGVCLIQSRHANPVEAGCYLLLRHFGLGFYACTNSRREENMSNATQSLAVETEALKEAYAAFNPERYSGNRGSA